jgi:hypothetical protein
LDEVELRRNDFGWVSAQVSQTLLRLIFPEYPDTRVCYTLPDWVKEKLK